MTVFRWATATDVGMVREVNQDSLLVAEPLFAVADGMGGHQGGEVASATALEVLRQQFAESHTLEDLLEAVRKANAKVWDKAQLDETLHGMGTTLTALARIADEDGTNERIAIVNVGDSRTYLLRDGELTQLTEDHSFVEEMLRTGQISAEEAETHPRRNILTRALGVEPTVEVDVEQLEPVVGDRLLLCSDGLVRELVDDQIASILRRYKNPNEVTSELVQQAKSHGGHDNITVVIVDVEDESAEVEEPPITINVPTKNSKNAKKHAPKLPKPGGRIITFRTVLFFLMIIGLAVIAYGSVVWYARASYFVGIEGEQITIYRGRPEPVLWFKPTVAERTNVSTAQVLPTYLPALREGETVASLTDAQSYVRNLLSAAEAARQAAIPPVVTTTTAARSAQGG